MPDLSGDDATLLAWYFGPGQSSFERSPMGGMLERAATYDNADAYHAQIRDHNVARRDAIEDDEFPMSFYGAPQFDAVPTAERRPAPSNDVDDKALRMFGKASRGLKRLRVVCEHGPDVMRGRYGEGSEDWAVKGFLLGGIYALTKSGRALVKQVRKEAQKGKAKLALSPAALLQNDYKRAVHFDDTDRLCEFGEVEGDARRLLSEVVGVWNDLHRGQE